MKRTELELYFRKLMSKIGFNFRFSRDRSTKMWSFCWWKPVPGNPLNNRHVLQYNYGWPISSYQPGRIRKKFISLHPELKNSSVFYGNIDAKYPDGVLKQSECFEICLNNMSRNASKDDAIFAVLSHPDFAKECGFPKPVHSIYELKILLSLMNIELKLAITEDGCLFLN